MGPEFPKNTIDILAKRASYRCSNPECRTNTVGPNADPTKALIIGEAAHIHAARPNGPRYNATMTDLTRAEITNGIWLCRNCHSKIDKDPTTYPPELLFRWRELHEQFVSEELGSISDRVRSEIASHEVDQFSNYPAIIRRIALDRPSGWEWRLTAELLRYLNRDHFRKLSDLRDGLYTRRQVRIDEEDARDWVMAKVNELSQVFSPLDKILARMTESWGKLGESGSVDDIHHSCLLLRGALGRMIEYEEDIRFASLPPAYDALHRQLFDLAASQATKLSEVSEFLDETLERLENGGIERGSKIEKTIEITLPEDWAENLKTSLGQLS